MIEHWKWVVGYHGLYKVSDFGRVKSVKKCLPCRNGWLRLIPERIRRSHPNKDNQRIQVSLYKNNRGSTRYVHHLVLEAFVGPKPDGMECCHFPDPDPTNNRLGNLRWDTSAENKQDMIFHGNSTRGEKNPSVVLTTKQVLRIKRILEKKKGKRGVMAQLAREYKVHPNTIRDINLGITWKEIKC